MDYRRALNFHRDGSYRPRTKLIRSPCNLALKTILFIVSLIPTVSTASCDGEIETIKLNLRNNKQTYYKKKLIKVLQTRALLQAGTDTELLELWKNNRILVQEILGKVMQKNSLTLSPDEKFHNPLTYSINSRAEITERTTAKYYSVEPKVCFTENIDFSILIPTNFGLTTYLFDSKGNIIKKFGSYNTAYYSVSHDRANEYIAMSIPGQYRTDLYDLTTLTLADSIPGYGATCVYFHDGLLFFAAHLQTEKWNEVALYSYRPRDKRIRKLTKNIFADVRGLAAHGGYFYVSDGAHHRIVVLDKSKWCPIRSIEGFRYPNNISFTPRETLLVADEHADTIREIKLKDKDYVELRSSPVTELRSPSSAIEIAEGKFTGHWLIADADQQRVLLVEPNSWNIILEITGLRSTLKAIPIFKKK